VIKNRIPIQKVHKSRTNISKKIQYQLKGTTSSREDMKLRVLLTFMELPCLFTLSAAFRASNPPSSWPTSTTDENPISEQNARSRST